MEDDSQFYRAPIGALQAEKELLGLAENLKALWLRLAEKERMHQGHVKTLMTQITLFTSECEARADRNERCAEMWAEVQKELSAFNRPTGWP